MAEDEGEARLGVMRGVRLGLPESEDAEERSSGAKRSM